MYKPKANILEDIDILIVSYFVFVLIPSSHLSFNVCVEYNGMLLRVWQTHLCFTYHIVAPSCFFFIHLLYVCAHESG